MMTYPTLSSSKLAAQAANLPVKGLLKAPEDGYCVMCGTHHSKGDSVLPFAPPDTFFDFSALRKPESQFMCVYCDAVWCKDFSQTHLKTVVTLDGVYSAASNDHIAYWLLNPPTGPWLFMQGDQKVQHLVFRTPVNYSQNIYQVQMGEKTVTIRREMLLAGALAAKALAAAATKIRQRKNPKGGPLKSPFVALGRDYNELSQGVIRHELLTEALVDEVVKGHITTIGELTSGELWGLTAVLYATNPVKSINKFSKE